MENVVRSGPELLLLWAVGSFVREFIILFCVAGGRAMSGFAVSFYIEQGEEGCRQAGGGEERESEGVHFSWEDEPVAGGRQGNKNKEGGAN